MLLLAEAGAAGDVVLRGGLDIVVRRHGAWLTSGLALGGVADGNRIKQGGGGIEPVSPHWRMLSRVSFPLRAVPDQDQLKKGWGKTGDVN